METDKYHVILILLVVGLLAFCLYQKYTTNEKIEEEQVDKLQSSINTCSSMNMNTGRMIDDSKVVCYTKSPYTEKILEIK